jgi:hypothetical protein
MSEIILNANDPNFKNLVSKLKAAGWISGAADTPQTKKKLKETSNSFGQKKGNCAF